MFAFGFALFNGQFHSVFGIYFSLHLDFGLHWLEVFFMIY